jgi:hypothetical protein
LRKLLFIIVLFFSTSVLAESYRCEMTIKPIALKGEQNYDLFIDIGDEEATMLSQMDGNKEDFVAILQSTGRIFFELGNPYGLSKQEAKIYLNTNHEFAKIGFFFIVDDPSIIEMRKKDNSWRIFISDTDTNFETTQVGTCR